ncbi:MAG TPA: DUF3617 family protein [Dissulfurispiraceae bacterium]|nr:DUF3617 family protein [Dissulfurispiraceae bacterium]
MGIIVRIMFAVVSIVLYAQAAFGAPNMQDGLWEVTTTVEMKGMPAGMMKPMTHTTCITRKDSVPAKPPKSDCKMSDMNSSGNTVSWTITCPESISKSTITYAGTTFEGTTETSGNRGGEKMHMKSRMKGKRIGPCK